MYRTLPVVLALAAFTANLITVPAFAAGNTRTEPFIQNAIEETVIIPPAPEPEPEFVATPTFEAEEDVVYEAPVETVAAPLPEPEPEPVMTEAMDKYGFTAGNFLLLPKLEISGSYNDNIYAENSNQDADMITRVKPHLRITLAESRHNINLEGGYELKMHAENSSENEHNFMARLHGYMAITDSVRMPYDVDWHYDHEDRTDDLTLQMAEAPLRKDRFKVESGIEFDPGSYGLALLGRYIKFRNHDGRDFSNNPVIRSDADYDKTELEGRAFFDFNKNNRLQFIGIWGENDYDKHTYQNGTFSGPKRGSQYVSGQTGWRFNYKGLLADFKAGIQSAEYDSIQIEGLRAFIASADVEYDLSEKTKLAINAARFVHEDEEFINPIIRNQAGVFVDYNLAGNFLVGGGAEYDNWEFENAGRQDDVWKFKFIADYLVNDYMSFGGEIDYLDRDSTAVGLDIDQTIFWLRARGRL